MVGRYLDMSSLIVSARHINFRRIDFVEAKGTYLKHVPSLDYIYRRLNISYLSLSIIHHRRDKKSGKIMKMQHNLTAGGHKLSAATINFTFHLKPCTSSSRFSSHLSSLVGPISLSLSHNVIKQNFSLTFPFNNKT